MTHDVATSGLAATPPLDSWAALDTAPAALCGQGAPLVRWRHGRLAAGLAALAGSLTLALYFVVFTATSEAVVTGRVVTLPTPISGTLLDVTGDAGDLVVAGQTVARVRNDRADGGRLDALRTQQSALRARLAAVRAEIEHKTSERTRLALEVDLHRRQTVEDFEHQHREAQLRADTTATLVSQHEREAAAAAALHDQQLIARLEFERIQTDLTAARQRHGEALSVAERLARRLEALRLGRFIGADTPPEKLRVHDLTLNLTTLRLQAQEVEDSLGTVGDAIAAEQALVGRLADAAIQSPVDGRVWKRAASTGQFVSAGSDVLEVVDASTLKVEAYFHQRYLRDIAPGDAVRVLPVGGGASVPGVVHWIGAEASAAARTLAPQWRPDQDTPMRVVIALDERARHDVYVGQRARVVVSPSRLPTFAFLAPSWMPW